MEIKIDMNGSDVELTTFSHSLTINNSQKEQTAVKTANTKKKERALIAGDASAEAVAALLFMALHDEFQRLYDYAEIMLDPKTYGVTIWQFMASIRYELNVRCDMLKEYEKKYGRVDLGPKWGLNQISGKPRKKNEAI